MGLTPATDERSDRELPNEDMSRRSMWAAGETLGGQNPLCQGGRKRGGAIAGLAGSYSGFLFFKGRDLCQESRLRSRFLSSYLRWPEAPGQMYAGEEKAARLTEESTED